MISAAITSQEFWATVATTPYNAVDNKPIVLSGVTLADSAEKFQEQAFERCSLTNKFVERFFDTPPKLVLDLGCGTGTNTLQMFKNGAHVTAVDLSEKLLNIFSEKSINIPNKENLHLINKDIATMPSYGGPFNLVIAVDILPYLPPTSLCSTMKKIHNSLIENGIIIGTIFTHGDEESFEKLFERIGAHFYSGDDSFVEQLLTFSLFSIIKIERSSKYSCSFIAKKLKA